MERELQKVKHKCDLQKGQQEMMLRELQNVREQCELQRGLTEIMISRLQGSDYNGLPLTTASGESVAVAHQKVDLALSHIISLEKSFSSLKRTCRQTQVMLEPQETVYLAACPLEFQDQLQRV